ncbi:MAG TPA: sulfotransferase [Steroidobacteraceae bacterium]|nr:sulfotransferase [Steroidobacteraceae bacterium]
MLNTREKECEPVFVVGMNGSGTTMLLDCLGRHPALYAFPKETRLIPYLMARQSAYGDLRVDDNFRALWEDVRNLAVFREVNGHESVPLPDDWREQPRSLAAILDRVFSHFATGRGKRRWAEKTPQHVQHLLSLGDLFPAARFVHVIRDGRDCAVSFHRRWRRQPELTVFRWKKVVTMGRRQGQRLGPARYLEVRYEDLTAEPERSLRRICRFLGLEFHPAVLRSAQPYLKSGDGARPGRLQRNSGKWRTYFPARTVEGLERIAGATLASCGYTARYPEADIDLSGWRRRYWSASETLREYASEVWRKLNGELERPWRVILVKPMNALRHRQHNVY